VDRPIKFGRNYFSIRPDHIARRQFDNLIFVLMDAVKTQFKTDKLDDEQEGSDPNRESHYVN